MPRSLILDTDIDTDCDDTGALAVLHHLARLGEIEISAVICSIPKRVCALCVDAINSAYDRSDVPIGLVRIDAWQTASRFSVYQEMLARLAGENKQLYNEVIGRDWEADHPCPEYPDALRLYRQALVDAEDQSVTICAVGTLTALQQLLDSPPDDISALSGRELITARVERLVTMALGIYPRGHDGFNWRMDKIGAAAVVNRWPGPVTVSELGGDVLVGPRFVQAAPATHPVRRAFEIWLNNWGRPSGARSSWDQLAVIRAVRGCGEIFAEHGGLGLSFDAETGEHEWSPDHEGHERSWIESLVSDAVLAQIVEDLMIGSLSH
ncbi:MAG: hypothetical protein HOH74_12760 [Gemmatimonadetes bacterium]|nr:hypothetical protein [Gemmatimonadota bacterium]